MVISGALFVSIIAFVIVIVMTLIAGRTREWGVFLFGNEGFWEDGIRPRWMRIFAVITTIVVFGGGGVFFGPWLVSFWASQTETTSTELSVAVTEPLGLKPGVSYPLVLGARTSASDTDIQAWGGLFGGYAQVRTVSGSAATISFTHEGTTSMLEIPVSHIKFMQTSNEAPSVNFTFKMATLSWRGSQLENGVTRLTKTTTTHYAPCETKVVNLVLYCTRGTQLSKESVTDELDKETVRHGLAPLVDAYADVVTIVLTPEMYSQLMGQIN